ncbi:glucokinase [Ideonella paludis]|uniref:Glucokinase n=1 Tax=Ideonella paludis TaxID=1233411 RepID=A0ABS5DRS5_9BURK|nr:glucokinase [Ideonella paludis]MBQ0933853.1 glucokinase [Ideonella paludis]
MSAYDSPRLIADIGGTFARFALETAPGHLEQVASLRCAEHADFLSTVQAYLATLEEPTAIRHAGIAIANPVDGDLVRMTNYHWQFSIEQTREQLGFETLVVVNDFTALAMAVPRLSADERRAIGHGVPREPSVVGVLGAGTGLGLSGLIPASGGWVALGTEGGHGSFSPRDEREIAILRHAWKQYGHVSFERLCSGPGLELIYRALAEQGGQALPPLTAPDITQRALSGVDPLCRDTVDTFCGILGTAASNLAVTLGAFGGVYIGGGIVPRLGDYFERSPFRARFEERGRFSDYVRAIPTYVITANNATFMGVSAILDAQLRTLETRVGGAILEQIRRSLDKLSPAEKRVASHVLAHPRAALNAPIADIARAADVSQPTVIRFCRSLGCEGLSDFKLRLASGLTGTIPITHTQVTGQDSTVELGEKVLSNTAAAILRVREQLNREAIERAITLLDGAHRIELHAQGHFAMVAQDAQFKFLRLGLPTSTCTDPRVQSLSAAVLEPGDVVIAISGSGTLQDLLDMVEVAHQRGAKVIAITSSHSPLAKRSDVVLPVDHEEDVSTHLPMVSRVLQLLAIDILAVGVALRRSGENPTYDGAGSLPAKSVQPGVSASLPLARLTTHSR